MQFVKTKTFQKNFESFHNQPRRISHINEVVFDFEKHLLQSKYYRKKLHGYENIYELEAGGDIRIFVRMKAEVVEFLNVGTHSSLGTTGNQKRKIR